MKVWVEGIGFIRPSERFLNALEIVQNTKERVFLDYQMYDNIGPIFIYPIQLQMRSSGVKCAIQINTDSRNTRLIFFTSLNSTDETILENVKYILSEQSILSVPLRKEENTMFGTLSISIDVPYTIFKNSVRTYDHDAFFQVKPKQTEIILVPLNHYVDDAVAKYPYQ